MKRLAMAFFFGVEVLVVSPGFGKEPNDTLNLLETVLQQIQNGVRTKEQLKDFVAGRNPFPKKEEATKQKEGLFPTKVNYDLSIESLIAQGKYDWKNDSITSQNFQTTRKGEATINLEPVHLNQFLTSDEVIAELKKKGLRPAEPHELLSFGIQYPEEQRKYPIVALGSVWRFWHGDRDVPFLWSDDVVVRRLYLLYFDFRWREDFRFLAVRES